MKKLFLLLFPVFTFFACGDDDCCLSPDPYTEELRINVVTGLQARDVNAAPIGVYGNPNTFAGEVDVYPNPTINQVNVQYFGGAGLAVKQYWIFPADKTTDYADVDYAALLGNATYAPDDVFALDNVFTDEVNAGAFFLNLDMLTAGYYRIFYLMSDETLLWDNLYVDPAANDLSALVSLVSEDF